MSLRSLAAALLLTSTTIFAGEWFVAPGGNDANPGTQAQPFATLVKARDAARVEKGTVWLRGGTHFIATTLKLGAEDSGVAWRAWAGERPVLIGGRAIEGWQPWKGGIFRADLAAWKLAKPPHVVVAGGRRLPLARYPNVDPATPIASGRALADGEPFPMYEDRPGEDKRTLLMRSADWRTWAHIEDAEVDVCPRYNWWNNVITVTAADPAKRTLTFAADASYAIRANDLYFVQGPLEELDAPGEWHYDRRTGALYCWPAAPLAEAPVFVATTRSIIEVKAASGIELRGLTLECAEGTAVVFDQARDCRVTACVVRNAGDVSGNGISINGGEKCVITGCDISHIGRNAITLGGGDRTTLTPSGHVAENNYLHHFGEIFKQGCGLDLSGVGQRVAHNLIHDGPRFGIQHSGNQHVIEFNRLRHLALETEDAGGIYSGGRDWLTPRGTVLRHNFISDIIGYAQTAKGWTSWHFTWGIYLDDNSAGADVIGNIITRCARGGLHCHSGRDNLIENNIFHGCGQWQVDFHGWTVDSRMWLNHFPTMIAGYEKVAAQPAWPALRNWQHPREAVQPDGLVMTGNVFARNILVSTEPGVPVYSVLRCPWGKNRFERNLVWAGGAPIRTGYTRPGKTIGENLVANAAFEQGELGKLPVDWRWQANPNKNSRAELAEHDGHRALRIDGAQQLGPDGQPAARDKWPIVISREIAAKPGHAYRLRARFTGSRPGMSCAAMLQFYAGAKDGQPGAFWASPGADFKLPTAWTEREQVFTIPAPGEKGYDARMEKFVVRFELKEAEGSAFIDDVELVEVEKLDEWQSWQALGNDLASVVADPQFLAADRDDFRLAPTSPALALGFQQIPVERIGPFKDERRASWPIVEERGAREFFAGRK